MLLIFIFSLSAKTHKLDSRVNSRGTVLLSESAYHQRAASESVLKPYIHTCHAHIHALTHTCALTYYHHSQQIQAGHLTILKFGKEEESGEGFAVAQPSTPPHLVCRTVISGVAAQEEVMASDSHTAWLRPWLCQHWLCAVPSLTTDISPHRAAKPHVNTHRKG